MTGNKTFVYKKIPTGAPVAGEHIAVEDRPIDITAPPAGGVILKLQYASLDPYLRGRMRDPSIKSYAPALEPEQGIANGTIGTVIKSDNADFPESTLVAAYVPIAQYARVENVSTIRKIENPHNLDISLFLGPLGMPGITAWSGYHKIGQPKKGETIFVSSAAGAVGQIVGQIAKREGLTVIGSVGSEEKLDFIKELGYDHGFIYKKEKPLDALKRLAPDGVDIYFDNVGGTHLEAALEVMKLGGRIVICGAIEQYNTPINERVGIRNLMQTIRSNIVIEGFLQSHPDFAAKYTKDHQEKMQQWFAEGSIKSKTDISQGIEHTPEAFIGMLEGKNFGKTAIKIE